MVQCVNDAVDEGVVGVLGGEECDAHFVSLSQGLCCMCVCPCVCVCLSVRLTLVMDLRVKKFSELLCWVLSCCCGCEL